MQNSRAFASLVLLAAAAGGLWPRAAWATCADVDPLTSTTTCRPPDVVEPPYLLNLRLLGEGGTLTAGRIDLAHRVADLPGPADLSLFTQGPVSISGTSTGVPADFQLVSVYNQSGVNTLTIGNQTTLGGSDYVLMLDSLTESALAGQTSTVIFNGRITTQNAATPLPIVTAPAVAQFNGIRNQVSAGGGAALTQIGADGVIELGAQGGAAATAARMFGVFTNSNGGGNATIESAGTIRILAAANYEAGELGKGAALYARSELGSSRVDAGGSIVVDNRLFATPGAGSAVHSFAEGGTASTQAVLSLTGRIETFGLQTMGASATHAGGGNVVATTAAASTVLTHGNGAHGISLSAAAGAVSATVNGTVSAGGLNAAALVARAPGSAVNVQVGASGALLGGAAALPSDVDAATQLGSAGLLIEAGAGPGQGATVANLGSIGAANDRAIALLSAAPLALTNGGTVAGYLSLAGADDGVTNSAQWVLRHAADTNGDGTRDTKRIATLDFGAGNDVFRNEASGVVRLAQVQNAVTVQADRQYLPDLMPAASHAITTPGVEQAHLVGLERFENRGLLTLRDMDGGGAAPVAGDVLLITSGSVAANGVLTPGATPAVFVADGGTLALDTVLDAGGAGTRTDLLVVDSVALGPNGPTRVLVSNAGGLGAATTGSGIRLVDVLGGAPRSAVGAFTLGAPVVAGAFSYNLFRSGVALDDGDWYLRSEGVVIPPPPPGQPPTQPPPGTPVPTYRPEAALFAALPEFLRNVDVSAPGSRQARLGDEAGGLTVARRGRVWARHIRRDIDTAQQGTVAPSSSGQARGYQFGVELFGGRDEAAAQIGLYGGRLDAEATIRGFSNGVQNTPVGRLEPSVTYAGVYVSRARGRGLYFDTVLQYGVYDGEAITFADGQVAPIEGTGGYASLETGYDFAVLPQLVIEPQLQIATQPQRVHDVTIVNARVEQSPANMLAGRAGLRLRGEFGTGAWRLQPYAGVSVWHGLSHQDETRFSGNGAVQTTLLTDTRLRAMEYAGGFSLVMGSHLTAFGEYSKLDSRGDAGLRHDATTVSGGLRLAW